RIAVALPLRKSGEPGLDLLVAQNLHQPDATRYPVIVRGMRIASLVPSATEILFALGLGDQVVAVTHECDYPEAAMDLPQLTRSVIPAGLPPGEIDKTVREVTGQGRHLYELDEELLKEEEPDLIVAQQLCEVCAVSFEDVRAVAERLESRPNVIS